ncbi:MAG: phosphoribosylglycinamide formyltransferase [Polyangia bacterium]
MACSELRLAVLVSGSGSTMVNLQRRIESGDLPARIAVVVSSRRKALGLRRAEEMGLTARALPRRPFRGEDGFDAEAYSAALAELLEPFDPELIAMGGFMTRLAAPVLDRWPVLNVHPALLPMFGGEGFYGQRVHEAVLEAGVKVTGATVHFADERYDRGPIVIQEPVAVREDDTPDTLAERVQQAERRIYPRAIELIARGRVRVEGKRARILEEPRR